MARRGVTHENRKTTGLTHHEVDTIKGRLRKEKKKKGGRRKIGI